MMDFKQAKEKKERGLSVNEAFEEMDQEKQKYKDVVIIGLTTDDQIEFSFSVGNDATAIGVLEVVKQYFIDGINE